MSLKNLFGPSFEKTSYDSVEAKKKNLELYEREERAKISEEILNDKIGAFNKNKHSFKNTAEQQGDYEHEYHSGLEKKNTELARLDAQITGKKNLFEALKDQKNTEIELLKESNKNIVENYKEMVELLKTQTEVLTAKLTELKITDAHIHVSAEVKDKKENND